jgi:hypothetical protein
MRFATHHARTIGIADSPRPRAAGAAASRFTLARYV